LQSETFQFGRAPLRGETGEEPLIGAGSGVLAWRDAADRLVLVNFGEVPTFVNPTPELPGDAELVTSTDPARLPGAVTLERFILLPREAVLLRLTGR
jgi:hypothetical protein